MKLQHKIALITGGSRGLGRNTALRFAGNGADVILTYRTGKGEAAQVVSEIEAQGRKAIALPLDTGRSETFAAFAEQLRTHLADKWNRNTFDFLINNAGMDVRGSFATVSEEDFDRLSDVHFKGVFFLTQRLLPLIVDGGRIVNVSTGVARFTLPGNAAYAAMKGAVEVLTRYLAKELGPRGITANLVAPGPAETDFTRASLGNPAIRDVIVSQTALGRTAKPDDITGVAIFLCSDEARWVTAQRIEASGGLFL
ncbi:SDR family oxidoreductase [Termitidicoccus mucosus]|uniref:Short-chain dehydrogenase n=1 Tax=Termitidicoccus mucosus TaxID=1184151 RepID=A0A178IK80_9BACT|nr:short-chain dehydrogenase [Opitutaceae bacterium TSB47]